MYTLELTEAELQFAYELVNAWVDNKVPGVDSGGDTNLMGKICEQLKKSTAK